MARNKYIWLNRSGMERDQLTILCTDKATLEWAVSEVRKYCPSAKLNFGQLPNGEPFSCFFQKIDANYRDLNVWNTSMQMWIVKQLCEQGWTIVNDEETSRGYSISLVIRAD